MIGKTNFSLVIPAVLLVFVSLSTFYTLNQDIFKQQLIFLLLALIIYYVFLNLNLRLFGYYSVFLYIIAVILLAILYFIGIEAKGATRWIEIFGINIQFSEIIKPFMLIFYASYLTKDTNRSFKKFIKALLLILPIFLLTLKQPDLGNAIIYLITLICVLFVYGFPIKYFLSLGALSIASIPLLYQFLLGYQKARLLSFLDYTIDPSGISYNSIQSTISVGSGELIGKGLGQATQSILKFLPERHTDFIFATIAESLGLAGSLCLIGLYFFLLYKILVISRNVDDEFLRILVQGFFFLFLVHIFFNVGMNLRIVPIVGITLPFVSYGGSSLMTNFIILGIISGIRFKTRRNLSMEIK